MSIDPQSPLRQIVLARAETASVFNRFGLDYCCGGTLSLEEACRDAGCRLDEVVAALECAPPDPAEPPGWTDGTLMDLMTHILDQHHTYTRTELARLEELLRRVLARHGDAHPELGELADRWAALRADLEPHLAKEETVLFPYVEALERSRAGQGAVPEACFGTVANPIRVMAVEHHTVGGLLKELRRISGGYQVPEDGCASYAALYQGLAALEKDLHRHIHLENNVLFPRALDLEQGGTTP